MSISMYMLTSVFGW